MNPVSDLSADFPLIAGCFLDSETVNYWVSAGAAGSAAGERCVEEGTEWMLASDCALDEPWCHTCW
jgi:hypothetical protein